MRRIVAVSVAVVVAGCSDTSGPTSDGTAEAALAWITTTAHPLSAVAPASTDADLAPFKTIAGSARVIGLGEATHGSKEFFSMKDRLFRYLVEEGGVTAFAIEATMPEAYALDTYVRTGAGDPAKLLSHLYFWTWNTQEVADLISGLRAWNVAHPDKQVGFYGFDMQYPGVAIDSVKSYVARVAPSMSSSFTTDYSCLNSYRNDTRGIFPQRYSTASAEHWASCGAAITNAHDRLVTDRATLVAASTEREYEFAVRMARIVVQWEEVTRRGGAGRDAAMAENTIWLLEREGTGGKLFLWAHNYHISRVAGSMGQALAQKYGADYLPVGFSFAGGGLNAVEGIGNGTFGSLKSFVAPEATGASYEEILKQGPAANYFIDMRQAPTEARAWFDGPRAMRSIGSVYFPSNPNLHFSLISLSSAFDALIFIKTTTPTVRLSFQY